MDSLHYLDKPQENDTVKITASAREATDIEYMNQLYYLDKPQEANGAESAQLA
jgi:hypothetical protein